MLRTISRGYRRHRFAWLFSSLLLTFGVHPVLEAMTPGAGPLQILLAANLLVAIASAADWGETRWVVGLAGAFALSRALQGLWGIGPFLPLSEALSAAACLLVMGIAARHAMAPGVVDGERIFAALDVYILAGLALGVGYWVLDQTWPASFAIASGSRLDLAHAVYFSFVTIATLGYGDIVPLSTAARGLAVLEAVAGQMYLAVLVARLVSLYARQTDGPPDAGGRPARGHDARS